MRCQRVADEDLQLRPARSDAARQVERVRRADADADAAAVEDHLGGPADLSEIEYREAGGAPRARPCRGRLDAPAVAHRAAVALQPDVLPVGRLGGAAADVAADRAAQQRALR